MTGWDFQRRRPKALRRVAGIMIPASETFNVPGADDPLIFADIVRSLGREMRHFRMCRTALAALLGAGVLRVG